MAEQGQHMDDSLYTAARYLATGIPIDVNDERFRYRTPGKNNNALHVAAQYGNQEFITTALTQLGEHRYQLLCQQNSKGETPLHLAAQFGHVEIVNSLLSGHGDVAMPFGNQNKPCWSERDKKGDTPLHRALRYRHEDIAMLLLDRDIHLVSVCNDAGESPAYLALEIFYNRFIERIVDADLRGECCVSFSGPFGRTVFHHARRLTADIMTRLIEIQRGAVLKAQDNKGKTVLHYAAEENRLAIVETLLKADNSLAYLQDNDGVTPLHIASKMGLFRMVETILELSPQSVEICDNLGKTALHVAKIDDGFLKKCLNNVTIKELINEADNDGNTPLHAALIKSEHVAAFQLLMVDGCNWRWKNNEGYSPLDLCKSNDKISNNVPIYCALRDLKAGRRELIGERESRRYSCRFWLSSAIRDIGLTGNWEWVKEEDAEHIVNKAGVAAVLLVPITFTTAFSCPGGYDTTGKPILRNQHDFNLTMLFNGITFATAMIILFLSSFRIGRRVSKKRQARICISFLQVALNATIFTFIFGTRAVGENFIWPSMRIAIIGGLVIAQCIVMITQSILAN